MGIFERIGDILGSNINAILDKAEDPVKMANYYLEQYMKDLAECKADTATIMAQTAARKREMDQAKADVDKLTAMATNALKAGNEDDARTILVRKASAQQTLDTATKNYEVAKQQEQKMVEVYNKLVDNITVCRAKVQNIQATSALAKNQQKVAGIMAKYGSGSTGADKLARAEEKAMAKLDTAEAMCALGVEESDGLDLEAKYGFAGTAAVDDELAKMKAELGLG